MAPVTGSGVWAANARETPVGHKTFGVHKTPLDTKGAYLHLDKIFSVLFWDDFGTGGKWVYLPMQNLLKMRLRMSSVVVVPVRVSRE